MASETTYSSKYSWKVQQEAKPVKRESASTYRLINLLHNVYKVPVHIYWKINSKKNKTLRERDCFRLREARKFNSAKHSFKTAFAINKGKLSTCTMSNVIEYEYVTGGPLKGGAASFQGGGANAPPRPA